MIIRTSQIGYGLCALLLGATAIAGCWPLDFAADPVLIGQRCEDGTLDCFGTTTSGTGSTTIDPDCVPAEADGPVDDACGVFVSSSLGGDGNTGLAKDQAFKTIAQALQVAEGRPIYLCGETFPEDVEVEEGATTIYGGLDCANGWTYAAAKKRSRIAPKADQIPLRVMSGASIELADVDLLAADATVPSGSSIALLAESDADVRLTRCNLEAGAGAEGESPLPVGTGTPGPKGQNGGEGCTGLLQQVGGPGGSNVCAMDTLNVSGGPGGIGFQGDGGDGSAGKAGGSMGGTLGTGQIETPAKACTKGGDGAAGMAGEPGAGATNTLLGTLNASGFVGATGSEGKTPGTPGAGAGGGGGAKTCINLGSGPGGGGGGAGGCGGARGAGGEGGGASIGIVSLGATFTFSDVLVTTAAGGKGGAGGVGQPGGSGGEGGQPGSLPVDETGAKACAGGKGGDGGPGGRGGGGRGGPSIGIAHTGDAPDLDGVTIEVGEPGDGGEGDGPDGNGAVGEAAPVRSFGT